MYDTGSHSSMLCVYADFLGKEIHIECADSVIQPCSSCWYIIP